MSALKSVFLNLCPNCGGNISSDRLIRGLPCSRCLKIPAESREEVCKNLLIKGDYLKYCFTDFRVREWEETFREIIGSTPFSLQKTWAKRVFLKRSFALIAPTGIGKTTFGLITAVYLLKKGQFSYIILPTKILVQQVKEKLLSMGVPEEDMVAIVSGMSKKREEEAKERIRNGDMKILITTSMFLYKNMDIIPRKFFHFFFVDDVDSFLKTARNIDKVLLLMGFEEKDIEMALDLIKLKAKQNKTERDLKRIEKLQNILLNRQKRIESVLVVSSATANPRTQRIKLFRELLGFEVGRPIFYLRNVVDTYTMDYSFERMVEFLKRYRGGGLVFVSSDKGKEYVDELVEKLNSEGIRALSYEKLNEEKLKEYERGEIDVLVGISSYRNPLARGIDMPHVIRYALFWGVPKIILRLNIESNPSHLMWALLSIRSLISKVAKEELPRLDRWISTLRRLSRMTRPTEETLNKIRGEVSQFFEKYEGIISQSPEITLVKEKDGYKMVVSDVTGYLQASGRTSRMYLGGITKGLSVIFVDDLKAFNHLQRKIRWFNEDIQFQPLEEIDIDALMEEITEERERIRRGEFRRIQEVIKPVMIVVESPNKARTIAKFFGRPVVRRINETLVYEVVLGNFYLYITASLGHVVDLTTKDYGYHGVITRFDGENGELIPVYETIEGKESLIQNLRSVAYEVEYLLTASDPDTEGEKIAWDILNLLRPYITDSRRMEFHEVTRKEIVRNLTQNRDIDGNLVKAQVVRRVADRWIGFEASHLIQRAFKNSRLSAGRVQTPVLGWIIEREKDVRRKKWVVRVEIDGFTVEKEFEEREKAEYMYKMLEKVKVETISEEEEEINPPPPFTTDSMLREAADRLKFPVPKTMNLAQELFEWGFITYHRTDSTRVSDAGISVARTYIEEEIGKEYFKPRTWGKGGAHECIRPTRPLDVEDLRAMIMGETITGLTQEHLKLYDLIFRRFIASQMRPAKVLQKEKIIYFLPYVEGADPIEETLNVEILERGFDLMLPIRLHTDIEGTFDVRERKSFLEVPYAYPYTHGDVIRLMKERGIGRPSTYAITIEKLLERKYIYDSHGFLRPTRLGIRVFEFLKKKPEIFRFLEENFTRQLEELMDRVEEGEADFVDVLKSLYGDIKRSISIKVGRDI